MRTKLGNKPLSHAMKDPSILKVAIEEITRINKIKKENELYADKKTKMFGMLLKAKRLKEEKKAEEELEAAELAKQTGEVSLEDEKKEGELPKFNPNVKYSPKR